MPKTPSESRGSAVARRFAPVCGATCVNWVVTWSRAISRVELPASSLVWPAGAGLAEEASVSAGTPLGPVTRSAVGEGWSVGVAGGGASCCWSEGVSEPSSSAGVFPPGDWAPESPWGSCAPAGLVTDAGASSSVFPVGLGWGGNRAVVGVAVGSAMRVAGSRSVIPASPATWAAASWSARAARSSAAITRYRVIVPSFPRRTKASVRAYGRYSTRGAWRCPRSSGSRAAFVRAVSQRAWPFLACRGSHAGSAVEGTREGDERHAGRG